ncbi:MAG: lysine transporter LysE [Stappia sp.]|uniref:LysE family translocator n=1 Tax=Stappia sp. TaxID=1870903 RepID=UPI000C685A51|nr:LysE family translocator [Stappia sp.]MAA97396.1 lysine transporter LysE [Stappia sp.]MBM21929.1 lysine transporter LysE [Stappia sp.]|tara:strand:- start:103 stop:714 length:612 start_codon:yes stop_codon:yes gene_type:complete
MSLETAVALVAFAFAMSVSPGPGNFLLLASGGNFGLRRTLPLLFGISFGFLAMVFGVGMGLGQILKANPGIGLVLRLACTAFIVWMAWKVAGSRNLGIGSGSSMERPFSFLQAAFLQLLNPKAWGVALTVTVTFLAPDASTSELLLLIGIFALVNLPAIGLWAVSGHWLRRSLSQGNRLAVFNMAMACLLVLSTLPMFLMAAE